MAARLTGFVHVTDPETGDVVAFGPDDRVPGWAKGLITNPAAWTQAPASNPDQRRPAKERETGAARAGANTAGKPEGAEARTAAADDGGVTPHDAAGTDGVELDDDPEDVDAVDGDPQPEDTEGDDGQAAKPRGNGAREAWAKWADSLGVSYDEDATRDEIKAAVAAAQA